MPVKEITLTRLENGDYQFKFNNKYMDDITIRKPGHEDTNAISDLMMASALLCSTMGVENRLPRHVKIKELRGMTKDDERKDEELLEFNVEASVSEGDEDDLERVFKNLEENGCGMVRMLKKTGMFKVSYNLKKI